MKCIQSLLNVFQLQRQTICGKFSEWNAYKTYKTAKEPHRYDKALLRW